MRASDIIRDEHRSLAAVLHGLRYISGAVAAGRMQPDFTLLDAMLDYIEGVPDQLHHPKEDAYLFPVVLRCAPETASVIEELKRQHASGAALLGALRDALEQLRAGLSDGAATFAAGVESYADFHWQHMRIEEDQILPVADTRLSAEEAASVDAAFMANKNLVEGGARSQEFRDLFRRIANLAPPPIGMGPEPR